MKDIIIRPQQIRIELSCGIFCLMMAIGANLYSIVKYQTDLSEMWTQWHIVLALTALFYALLAAFRIALRWAVAMGRRHSP
jgi:hypothetical protein